MQLFVQAAVFVAVAVAVVAMFVVDARDHRRRPRRRGQGEVRHGRWE